MTNTELRLLRQEMARYVETYDRYRARLGEANKAGTNKTHIFQMLNKARTIVLNNMMAIRIELERRRPVKEMLDIVTKANSAFTSFDDLLNSNDNYNPSMDMRLPQMKFLANHFDKTCEALGKKRRAYRYGVNW